MPTTIQTLGLDVETYTVKRLVAALRRLKSTQDVQIRGVYREVPGICQVFVQTTKTVDELDAWAYGTSAGCGVVGIFIIEPAPMV